MFVNTASVARSLYEAIACCSTHCVDAQVMLAASKPHDEVIDATIATSQLTLDTNNINTGDSSKLDNDREPLLGKREGTANSSTTSVSSSIAPSYGSTTQ